MTRSEATQSAPGATSVVRLLGNTPSSVRRLLTRSFFLLIFFRLRSRDVFFPGAEALEELLRPFIGRLEHHLLADAADDHLVLVVGETAGTWQADGLAAANAEDVHS